MFQHIQKHSRILLIGLIGSSILIFIFLPRLYSPKSVSEEQLFGEANQIESVVIEEPIDIPEPLLVELTVDVQGAVRYPGTYTFSEGARIREAIEAAGGYEAEADATHINHAQKLVDEAWIYIPKIGEELPEPLVAVIPSGSGSSTNEAGSSTTVSLNHATKEELQTVPGIGPAKAQAIVDYREQNGPFKTKEQIKEVSGIGDKTYEKLEPSISVQ